MFQKKNIGLITNFLFPIKCVTKPRLKRKLYTWVIFRTKWSTYRSFGPRPGMGEKAKKRDQIGKNTVERSDPSSGLERGKGRRRRAEMHEINRSLVAVVSWYNFKLIWLHRSLVSKTTKRKIKLTPTGKVKKTEKPQQQPTYILYPSIINWIHITFQHSFSWLCRKQTMQISN